MTKSQWEQYCIDILRDNPVFTVFWATENKFIANAMDRLISSGRIQIDKLHFPISKAIIK